jgi:hypothetical protein
VIALVVVWWLQQGSDEADTLPEATTRYSSESDGEIRPLSDVLAIRMLIYMNKAFHFHRNDYLESNDKVIH